MERQADLSLHRDRPRKVWADQWRCLLAWATRVTAVMSSLLLAKAPLTKLSAVQSASLLVTVAVRTAMAVVAVVVFTSVGVKRPDFARRMMLAETYVRMAGQLHTLRAAHSILFLDTVH
jgi:hypothetical protein